MRSSAILFALLSVIATVFAQTAAQYAAQIPSCAETCDKAGIEKAHCNLTDYACHCANSNTIKAVVVPCLQQNSTCTTSELTQFATLVGDICAALNTTVATGTGNPVSPSATSTVIPFTGAAVRVGTATGLALLVLAAMGVSVLV